MNVSESDKTPSLAADLLALIDLLEADGPVAWYEVEELVQVVPGWLHLVRRLQAAPSPATPYLGTRSMPHSGEIPDGQRRQLARYFWPYALLLDTQLTPGERALRLRENAEVDPFTFCKEQMHNGQPEIVRAAHEVLDACAQQEELLRGSSRAEESPNALLRAASAQSAATDSLLHPAAPDTASQTPAKRPFWQFWRGKRAE